MLFEIVSCIFGSVYVERYLFFATGLRLSQGLEWVRKCPMVLIFHEGNPIFSFALLTAGYLPVLSLNIGRKLRSIRACNLLKMGS